VALGDAAQYRFVGEPVAVIAPTRRPAVLHGRIPANRSPPAPGEPRLAKEASIGNRAGTAFAGGNVLVSSFGQRERHRYINEGLNDELPRELRRGRARQRVTVLVRSGQTMRIKTRVRLQRPTQRQYFSGAYYPRQLGCGSRHSR
jgi:hypothetical protein